VRSQEFLSAAEIVGELDDPSCVNLVRILDEIADSARGAEFLHRLMVAAKLSENAGWLPWLASLPDTQRWIDSTTWIYDEFLRDVMNLAEVAGRQRDSRSPSTISHLTRIAVSVRNWSPSGKFTGTLAKYDGHIWHQFMPFVAEHAPTNRTLDWLSDNVGRSWRSRFAALEALPLLVVRAREQNQPLDGGRLIDVYCRAGSLVRSAEGLKDSDDPRVAGHLKNERVAALTGAFLGNHAHRGLLREAPEPFMSVAFDIVSSSTAEQERRRDERLAPILAGLADSKPSLESTATDRVAEDLRARYPVNAKRTVQEVFIDDVGSGSYFGFDEERKTILTSLHSIVVEDLQAGGELVSRTYWPAAKASQSAVAWVLLLDEMRRHPGVRNDLLDEILIADRLYGVMNAHKYLYHALKHRWPSLDPQQRARVIENVEATASSSTMNGIYAVAPLLAAIPPEQRPDRLNIFFKLYRPSDLDPPYPDPDDDGDYEWSSATSLDARPQNPWGKVVGWLGQLGQPEDSLFLKAVSDLRAALASGLPDKADTGNLYVLESFLREIRARRDRHPAMPAGLEISTDEARLIFSWGLDVLRTSTRSLQGAPEALDLRTTSRDDSSLWRLAIELLDEALVHPEIDADPSCARAFFDEIVNLTRSRSPKVVWQILRTIRPYNWLKSGGPGRVLLLSTLNELRDGGALTAGFSLACRLGPNYRVGFFRRCLASDAVTALPESMDAFLRQAGQFLGRCAFARISDKPNDLRELIEEMLTARPTVGILSRPENYVTWVEAVAFGAKSAIQEDPAASVPRCPSASPPPG